MLLAALGAAGCHAPPRPAAAAGYLAASGSSIAFLRWPAGTRADVAGMLELNAISGTAPHRTVSARSYPFTGHVSRRRVVTIRIGGRTARGRFSGGLRPSAGSLRPAGGSLRLGPLPGSPGRRTFTAATADSFGRAVAALRDQVSRSDAAARNVAAGVALRQQQAAQGVAGLVTAAKTVRQDRRVVSSDLRAMREVTAEAAGALGTARSDARQGLAEAHRGASRVQVCDYAVQVDADAAGVSAYSLGLSADVGSLSGDVSVMQASMTALGGQLRAVLRQQPGYRGGGAAPSPAQVTEKISRARARIAEDMARADGYVSLENQDVAEAYRLSARAAAAGTCRSASPPPPPLPPVPRAP
jgi:hypothetical protein